ncbi:MAG: ADP-ribosylglycohydrolase family protein [Myxococcales bacterium]|nr:ADP-ribosylglycohydrolase family protein [Myxococcales bacterium]
MKFRRDGSWFAGKWFSRRAVLLGLWAVMAGIGACAGDAGDGKPASSSRPDAMADDGGNEGEDPSPPGSNDSEPPGDGDASNDPRSDGRQDSPGDGDGLDGSRLPPADPPAGERFELNRQTYRDRLIAMWLGQSIANWTGLLSEGQRNDFPFYTDDDWGTDQGHDHIDGSATGTLDFNFMAPWGSDDDTDIEFIYLWTMFELREPYLSPREIQAAWNEHTEPGEFIWVSNLAAQELMRGSPAVLPPSTSLFVANDQSLMIDAQLTTEFFGALAPGRPDVGLALADLPIRTTASGYAAHAAQFFVALYSLAPVGDPEWSPREQILWMVEGARRLIPDTSKTAHVVDFVLADYLDNPDPDDWERTRDGVAQRFQVDAEEHGYAYLEWYESGVNLATGVIALLYGEGDFRRTVKIGTLSGWDSDNGTASMGGLLGLLLGTDALRQAFPGQDLSTEYDIGRTRVGFDPDLVSMEEMADRMLSLVDGLSGGAEGVSIPAFAPDIDSLSSAAHNPLSRMHALSLNNASGSDPRVTVEGGEPAAWSPPDAVLADGVEFDFSGRDRQLPVRPQWSYPHDDPEPLCIFRDVVEDAEVFMFEVAWEHAERLAGVQLVEGYADEDGGPMQVERVEVHLDGDWTEVALVGTHEPNETLAYELHVLTFATPQTTDGVRIRGRAIGSFVTLCELDGTLSNDPG